MPLSNFTYKKLLRTNTLVGEYGGAYMESVAYREKSANFLPLHERSQMIGLLANRVPKNIVWFDIECLRGGWGLLSQAKVGRLELRLIISFKKLDWSGVRRCLDQAGIAQFVEQYLSIVCEPGRYTEAECERVRVALMSARTLWCIDEGESWSSAYYALVCEQARERVIVAPQLATRLWQKLSDSQKSEALQWVRGLWGVPNITDEICYGEFYALVVSLSTRWGSFWGGQVEAVPSVVAIAKDIIQDEAVKLTRPRDPSTINELVLVFGGMAVGGATAVERSQLWFEHIGTGPFAMAYFGRGPQLRGAIELVAKHLQMSLGEIGHKAVDQTNTIEALYRRVLQIIKVPRERLLSWLQAGAPQDSKLDLPVELSLALFDPVLDPQLTADIKNIIPVLVPTELAELDKVLNDLVFNLEELQYFWYTLWDGVMTTLDVTSLITADSQRYPLWDMNTEQLVKAFSMQATNWAKVEDFDARQAIEQYIVSMVEQVNREDILVADSPSIEDLYSGCAQSLAQNSVPITGAVDSLTVAQLISRYEISVGKKKRAGFERLQLVRELGITTEVTKKVCLKILDWYDGLLEELQQYKTGQAAWNEILNLETQEMVDDEVKTDVVAPVSPPSTQGFSVVNEQLLSKPEGSVTKPAPMPDFLFDEADEHEAEQYRNPKPETRNPKVLESELRELAESVIIKNNFSFTDESGKSDVDSRFHGNDKKEVGNDKVGSGHDRRRRFINLFVTRLKDVRDVVEFRESLGKPFSEGGLELSADKVEAVVKVVEEAKRGFTGALEHLSTRTKVVSELDKLMAGESVSLEHLNTRALEQVQKPEIRNSKPEIIPNVQMSKLSSPTGPLDPQGSTWIPASAGMTEKGKGMTKSGAGMTGDRNDSGVGMAVPKNEERRTSGEERPIKPISPFKLVVPKTNLEIATSSAIGQTLRNDKVGELGHPVKSPVGDHGAVSRRLTDIKAPPRLLGPLEELKSLNLIDFRRLGLVPEQALLKIKSKIDLISEASVAKRFEAVRAWQASAVYQLYLKLGRASIESDKTVTEVAAQVLAAGEEALTEAEFNAIADFNSRLRF